MFIQIHCYFTESNFHFVLFRISRCYYKQESEKKMFPFLQPTVATAEGSSDLRHQMDERNKESHTYEGVRKYIYSTPFIVCINYILNEFDYETG